MEGYLGRFLAVVGRAAVSMAEQVSVKQDAQSFGQMPRSEIAGLSGISVFSF